MDYVEAFKNLKTNNKFSRKSPHKAILLLSIIDLYESCTLTENMIKYDDELLRVFHKMWNKVLPNESSFLPDAYLPFWFMQSEGFWHIVPIRGKEDILTLMRDAHTKPSESKIKDCVNYAELDEDLYFLMTLQSGRSSLKRALLETYSTLSTKTIDRMSASEDNFVDNSAVALNEFENILNSNTSEDTNIQGEVNKEIEKRFFSLKEDIQYVLNIEYYTFLKNHPNERDMFKEICSSVYELYDKMTLNPIRQGEIAPSIAFIYENFLADLKITLISEESSFELIDSINAAIDCLREQESKMEVFQFEEEKEDINKKETKQEDRVTSTDLRPLTPVLESRRGKPWADNEEELITLLFQQGMIPAEIAKKLGRTELSIKLRLAKLGLMEYTYGQEELANDNRIENSHDIDVERDYKILNSFTCCCIYDKNGERIFSDSGQLKFINKQLYRLNLKNSCFTVKRMVLEGCRWVKGGKMIVAYPTSSLYSIADNATDLTSEIEDISDKPIFEDCKIKVSGSWFDYCGNKVDEADSNNASFSIDAHTMPPLSNFIPKGKLKKICDVAKSSYDFLWMMAIVEFTQLKPRPSIILYDKIACMEIAIAWEILNRNGAAQNTESSLSECIEYLIEESKDRMDETLDWSSNKKQVFLSIKDYPMTGAFEDMVDELLEQSPCNILKAWFPNDDESEIVALSTSLEKSCLYAIYPDKRNPYIKLNQQWLNYLLNEYDNLMRYFRECYLDFIEQTRKGTVMLD